MRTETATGRIVPDVPITRDGTYTLRARLGTPAFARHGDADDEPALARGVTVESTEVELSTEGHGSSH